MPELTELLSAARQGDARAAGEAFSVLYDELRRLARAKLRQHQPMTLLDTTALVHESYLRVMGADGPSISDRHHFFAYAARVMRSVIVDLARARLAERRGGGAEHVALDTAVGEHTPNPEPEDDVIRVHEALEALAEADPKLVQVVEMRYFAGMTEVEVAEALAMSERSVRRLWEKARLLLTVSLKA